MLIYLQMLESPEERSILEQIYLEYRGLMYHVAYEFYITSKMPRTLSITLL